MAHTKPRTGTSALAPGISLVFRDDLATPTWYVVASAQLTRADGRRRQRVRKWSTAAHGLRPALEAAAAFRAEHIGAEPERILEEAEAGIRARPELLATLSAAGLVRLDF